MTAARVTQISCDGRGCDRICHVSALTPSPARDALAKHGWSSEQIKHVWYDLCPEHAAMREAEKEAKKAAKEKAK